MKELNRRELTIEQKLGMLLCANINHGPADVDYAIKLIREHKLGAVWLQPEFPGAADIIRRVVAEADYPLLVFCDAECGVPGYGISQQIALGAANGGDEALAFSFGRLTASLLHEIGYNMICNPVVDIPPNKNMPCGATVRTFGSDLETVNRLAAALARGQHAGGVLNCAKHYPGVSNGMPYDTHMREGYSELSAEELLARDIVPYIHLHREGLLDCVMVGHMRYPKIDPDRPASLSRGMIDLLRGAGYDGMITTDALNMMGIVLKYGETTPIGISIAAGADLPLPWGINTERAYAGILECYRKGLITDEMVETALDRVLAAQHKVALLPPAAPPLSEDIENVRRVHRESIAAVCAEGVSPAISRDGKHLFTIVTDKDIEVPVDYVPGPRDWFFPPRIAACIRELFPNSEVTTLPLLPTMNSNIPYFDKQTQFDDIVFITQLGGGCYIGREHLTTRVVDIMDALQTTDRIVAHLHFGNPFVAADAPFVPRILIGYASEHTVNDALDILAGEAEPLGKLPFEIDFHKKGDFLGY